MCGGNELLEKTKGLRERDLKSKMILYDPVACVYVDLNETAKYIWDLIDKKTLDEIIENYAKYYGVDLQIAETDVYYVVEELEQKGIISINRSKEVNQ
ncbi:MAG: PqqD family protein [Methanotrichaceae archaeon]